MSSYMRRGDVLPWVPGFSTRRAAGLTDGGVVATRGGRPCYNRHPSLLPVVGAFAASDGGLLRRRLSHALLLQVVGRSATSAGRCCYKGVQHCYLGEGVLSAVIELDSGQSFPWERRRRADAGWVVR
jgi:hypothetical protein